MSEFFLLKRGCRQGDPLSPYIFRLCAEVLGQMLRKNINIKGIVINNIEMKYVNMRMTHKYFWMGQSNR